MTQSLLEMTKELVAAQMRIGNVPAEDTQTLLRSTHATLQRLQQAEQTPAPEADAQPPDWQRSIARHAIFCLECGQSFKQLSLRHLRRHDLNPKSYREKYGIPKTQPLSARMATARRRELAQEIRPWEKAPKRGRRKAAAKRLGGQM